MLKTELARHPRHEPMNMSSPLNCNLDTEAYNRDDSGPIGLTGSPHGKKTISF
jgi:hypothetical protein